MKAYLGATAHYITKEWELRTKFLALHELEGSHSGENIGLQLYNTIHRFGIQDKVSKTQLYTRKVIFI